MGSGDGSVEVFLTPGAERLLQSTGTLIAEVVVEHKSRRGHHTSHKIGPDSTVLWVMTDPTGVTTLLLPSEH